MLKDRQDGRKGIGQVAATVRYRRQNIRQCPLQGVTEGRLVDPPQRSLFARVHELQNMRSTRGGNGQKIAPDLGRWRGGPRSRRFEGPGGLAQEWLGNQSRHRLVSHGVVSLINVAILKVVVFPTRLGRLYNAGQTRLKELLRLGWRTLGHELEHPLECASVGRVLKQRQGRLERLLEGRMIRPLLPDGRQEVQVEWGFGGKGQSAVQFGFGGHCQGQQVVPGASQKVIIGRRLKEKRQDLGECRVGGLLEFVGACIAKEARERDGMRP